MSRFLRLQAVALLAALGAASLPQFAHASWGRTPITRPYVIDKSGSYYLANNITVTTGIGIEIKAAGVAKLDVQIDMNGYTIEGPAGTCGICTSDAQSVDRRIVVVNGRTKGMDFGIRLQSGRGEFTVRQVSVTGAAKDGIYLSIYDAGYKCRAWVQECSVQDVVGGGGYGRGIFVGEAEGSVVRGNRASNCLVGMSLNNSSNSEFMGNTIERSTGTSSSFPGLMLNSDSNCRIMHNNVVNGASIGVVLGSSAHRNFIVQNNFVNNQSHGLMLQDASDNHIERNQVSGNGVSGLGHGIYLCDACHPNGNNRNTFDGNSCVGNADYGIFIESGCQNIYKHNGLQANARISPPAFCIPLPNPDGCNYFAGLTGPGACAAGSGNVSAGGNNAGFGNF